MVFSTTMIVILYCLFGFIFAPTVDSLSPMFAAPVTNITVPRGREAKFTCKVRHLGGYRVGWVKADTKAIQAIHTHVITHNPRVLVTYDDHSTWHLILKQVTEEDKGPYMCQINTDPMISQLGHLEVVTPPEIDDVYSTSDVVVTEGSSALLRCVARGHPHPKITWKREDESGILISDGVVTTSVPSFEGEMLELPKVTRDHMGIFLCIANNKVPPQVSKRIKLEVHFHPIIHVPNQLIGSPYGRNVTMHCNVEASPPPVTFWNNANNEMLSNSSKYFVTSEIIGYLVKMTLVLLDLAANDIGDYKCVARNSIGKVESTIKVNYIQPPTLAPTLQPPPISYVSPDEKSIVYGPIYPDNNPGLSNNPGLATNPNEPVPLDNEVWIPSEGNPWSQNAQRPLSPDNGNPNKIKSNWIPTFLDPEDSNAASSIYDSLKIQYQLLLVFWVVNLC